jgi:hypothetical protein
MKNKADSRHFQGCDIQRDGLLQEEFFGSYLVRFQAPTTTPIPATVWLFGAGILGLFGIRRKMKN